MKYSTSLIKVATMISVMVLALASCNTQATTYSPNAESSVSPSSSQQYLSGETQMVTGTAIGRPAATSRYVFWIDARDAKISLQKTYQDDAVYGFDTLNRKEFLVSRSAQDSNLEGLVAEENRAAWIAWSNSGQVIRVYNVVSERTVDIAQFASPVVRKLLISKGNLYYVTVDGNYGILNSYNFDSGNSQVIRRVGNVIDFFVQGDTLVWHEDKTSEGLGLSVLYVGSLTNSSDSTLVQDVRGDIYGYTVTDNKVIYTCSCYNANVHVYDLNTKSNRSFSANVTSKPVSNNSYATWMSEVSNQRQINLIRTKDVEDAASKVFTVATSIGNHLDIIGFVSLDVAAFISENEASATRSIYLISVFRVQERVTQNSGDHATACDGRPLHCGQVVVVGDELRDYNGTWHVKGIHFILPQTGINGKTFEASNYCNALRNWQTVEACRDYFTRRPGDIKTSYRDSLEHWLGISASYFHANLLRIYVSLPDEENTGCVGCVVDFAERADRLGIRLGIVVRNSSVGWNASAEAFLSKLLNEFRSRQEMQLIAYISADNEINNHSDNGNVKKDKGVPRFSSKCGGGGSCFETHGEGCENNLEYIENALRWVRSLHNFLKIKNDYPVLLTVGIATNFTTSDFIYLSDFFKGIAKPDIEPLASYVDFLSPHNYGDGGKRIKDALTTGRQEYGIQQYSGPVVLEEYGYPTDPYHGFDKSGKSETYSARTEQEGDSTAPYYVRINASYIRSLGYAGGSAFMLADLDSAESQNTGQNPCSIKSSDFYTGLFTAKGVGVTPYPCGGTTTEPNGHDKSTGREVKAHHEQWRLAYRLVQSSDL